MLAARTAAASTAMTTPARLMSGPDGLPAERADPPAQPFLEIDLRLPAEHLAGARDVRPAYLRIVDGERFKDDLARGGRDLDHGLGELEHRHLVIGVAEVHRQVLAAERKEAQPADQVIDVAERARLRPVAVDGQRLAVERLVDEVDRSAAVVTAHARAVGVEDARDARVHSLLLVVRHRQRLGVALRLVVDAARPDRVHVAPVGLRLRMHLRVAVHLARRGDQKAGALPLGETKGVMRAVGADLQRRKRHAHVVHRAGKRREMEHEVDGLVDGDRFGDVVIQEGERVVLEVRDVLERAGLEVVDADDPMPFVQQSVAQMRRQKAGAAGDNGSRHCAGWYSGRRFRVPILTNLFHTAAPLGFSPCVPIVGTVKQVIPLKEQRILMKQRILITLSVAAAALIVTAAALAANLTTTATVSGTAGISLNLPANPSVTNTIDGTDQTASYAPVLGVVDARGTGAGWNLTISATALSDGSGHTLAQNVSAVSSACHAGSTCTNATSSGITYPLSISTTAAKFFSSALNTGMGKVDVTPTIQIPIPGNSYAGTYTSTVTLA